MSFLRQFQGRRTRLKIRVRTIFRPGQRRSNQREDDRTRL